MAANPKDFWEAFGDTSEYSPVTVTCESSDHLAAEVLAAYGIKCGTPDIGGKLNNLDIKRMDAMQVIKMSLLEQSATDGKMYEPIMSSEGEVEFVEIGSKTGISGGDVYYELQTGTYREYCGGVMVTGNRPLAYRRPVNWVPIWQNGPKDIYDTGLMTSNCILGDFNQQCTIVFNNPHLDSAFEDGIDNLYEITKDNAYDSIMGYATYIYFDGYETNTDTVVKLQDSTKILIKLETPALGTLFKRPAMSNLLAADLKELGCFETMTTAAIENPEVGVMVPIPSNLRYEDIRGTKVDKFNSIAEVIVIGMPVVYKSEPHPDVQGSALMASPDASAVKVTLTIDHTYKKVTRLTKGAHYVVGYKDLDTGEKQPYIIFADNSQVVDPINIDGTKTFDFSVYPGCAYAQVTQKDTITGYMLPLDEHQGILVEEIHVAIVIDSPSIEIYDPDGWSKKARQVADSLEYLIAPLIVVEEPSPIAFNGEIIDQTQGIRDHDPTTAQDFEDTDLEKALDAMNGNGTTLSLSFLDEDQCKKLSGALFDYMNSGDGIESTYVCSPDAEVNLGGVAPNGGIVNSISYSYQDSNSYTISVNAGQVLMGSFAQSDGGPSPKMMEEISAKGTIIEDMGNHVHFKVRIDGIGDRIAINMCPTVLRVGDKVQCSVHNNPVEL